MRALPLLLIVCAAVAEDQPAPSPVPKPAAGTTVPTPAAPPTPSSSGTNPPSITPSPTPTPPAPSSGAPTTVTAPTASGSRGQAAGAAGAAASAPPPRPFTVTLELDAGADSNVLYQDNSNPNATRDHSLDLGGDIRATYHAVQQAKAIVNVVGDVRYDDYPSIHDADYLRAGAAVVGQYHLDLFDPGMVLGYNKLYIGDAAVASVARVSVTATRIDSDRRNVESLIIDCQPVHYDHDQPDSGALYDVLLRHWWLFEPGSGRKRVEVSLGAGDYAANVGSSSYRSVTPGLAVKDRFDNPWLVGGPLDVAAGSQIEFRHYEDAYPGLDTEHQTIWSADASIDRWLSSSLSVGLYGIYTFRDSNIDGRSYRRFQEGVRLLATW